MSKKRVSLVDVVASDATRSREPVAETIEEPRLHPQRATKRPHVSLYLDPRVQIEIKKLAIDLGNMRPHDLYLEAVDLLLAKHGRPSVKRITS